jgi:hypothetical protein
VPSPRGRRRARPDRLVRNRHAAQRIAKGAGAVWCRQNCLTLLGVEIGQRKDLLVPGDELAVAIEDLNAVRHFVQDGGEGGILLHEFALGLIAVPQFGTKDAGKHPDDGDEPEHDYADHRRLEARPCLDGLARLSQDEDERQCNEAAGDQCRAGKQHSEASRRG